MSLLSLVFCTGVASEPISICFEKFGGGQENTWLSAQLTAAMLLARDHVAARDCSLVPNCRDILPEMNGTRTPDDVSLTVVDSAGKGLLGKVAAAKECGHSSHLSAFVFGQTDSITTFLPLNTADDVLSIGLTSHTTPELVKEYDAYSQLLSVGPSPEVEAEGLAGFVNGMGWKRMAMLIYPGELGFSLGANYLSSLDSMADVALDRVVLAGLTQESITSQLDIVASSGVRIISADISADHVSEVLFAAQEAHLFAPEYVWLGVGSLNNPDALLAISPDPNRLRSLLYRIITIQARSAETLALAKFRASLQDLPTKELNKIYGEPTASAALQAPLSHRLLPIAYDTIWCLAAGHTKLQHELDRMERNLNESHTAADLLEILTHQDFQLPLMSGTWQFDDLYNREYSQDECVSKIYQISSDGALVEIGQVEAGAVSLVDNSKLQWRDGTVYPSVPRHGRHGISATAIAVSSLVLLTVVLLAAWLLYHRGVQHRLKVAQGKVHVPLEQSTPLNEAASILQEVSGRLFLTRGLRDRAFRACSVLMTAKDIYAPHLEINVPDDSDSNGGGNTDVMAAHYKVVLEQTVANRSDGDTFFKTSSPSPEGQPRSSNASAFNLLKFNFQSSKDVDSRLLDMADAVWASHRDIVSKIGRTLHFNTHHLAEVANNRPLLIASLTVMEELNLFEILHLDKLRFASFAAAVESGYHDQPYHNAVHAADVLCRLTGILVADNIFTDGSLDSSCYLLSAVIAAMTHDYGHPGLTNDYQVATDSELSRLFNRQVVLENYSLYATLEMLRKEEMNFMDALPKSTVSTIVSTIIHLVLNTDMKKHFSIVSDFRTKIVSKVGHRSDRGELPSGRGKGAKFTGKRLSVLRRDSNAVSAVIPKQSVLCVTVLDSWTSELKLLSLSVALKVADIGHSYMPWDIHIKWSQALETEFFNQGRKEILEGRTPSPLMDPNKPGVMAPMNQVAFSNMIAVPLVQSWQEAFKVSGGKLLEQAHSNLKKWQDLAGHAESPPTRSTRVSVDLSAWARRKNGGRRSSVDISQLVARRSTADSTTRTPDVAVEHKILAWSSVLESGDPPTTVASLPAGQEAITVLDNFALS